MFKSAIYAIFFLVCLSLNSCSSIEYTTYKLHITMQEFKIKHSPDIVDRSPEPFVKVQTEIETENSDTYDGYEIIFAEGGEEYTPTLKGRAVDKEIEFFVGIYDMDLLSDIADELILPGTSNSSNYIGGKTIKLKIDDGIMSGTVTIDNDDLYLVFSYSIDSIDE